MAFSYENYLSPFTWRYGSREMRAIWSEAHKRRLWRRIWAALAEIQAEFGLVTPEQAADLRAHQEEIDVEGALQIEAEIHHDVMAEIRTFAGQCSVGRGIIHLGMTSMDVVDNADALRVQQSLGLILARLKDLLDSACVLVERWADTPVMAFTHLQPAEPTTLGYRLAQYAQDLFMDWRNLHRVRKGIRGKGLKGAVGTGASFADLLGAENFAALESRFSEMLGLPFFLVTTQTYPRKQDYEVVCALAGLGASVYKFAFDLRLLQSPAVGELAEPRGPAQVGSSAMPFKRNPIHSEKMDSLARLLAQYPRVAWDNAAHSLLERTLDDSANRRAVLPEAFLIADELLRVAERVMGGMQVDPGALARNLALYGPFAATERVLMALGKAGADRQEMHERLRRLAMQAWRAVQAGDSNPLLDLILADREIERYLSAEAVRALMDVSRYVGDAPQRARALAARIRTEIADR